MDEFILKQYNNRYSIQKYKNFIYNKGIKCD